MKASPDPALLSLPEGEVRSLRDAAPGVLPAIWVGAAGRPVVLRALRTDDDGRLGDFVTVARAA